MNSLPPVRVTAARDLRGEPGFVLSHVSPLPAVFPHLHFEPGFRFGVEKLIHHDVPTLTTPVSERVPDEAHFLD